MSFVKKHRKAAIAILIAAIITILLIVGFIVFISFLPRDNNIKYDEAIKIAKKDFGCDKILWIDTNVETALSTEDEDILYEKTRGNAPYSYYIIGEKDGEEIYIIIPSYPQRAKPFVTTWVFDYSFSQIVDKFNENGVGYVADVPDDIYSTNWENYLDVCSNRDIISEYAKSYDIGVDGTTFYARLDVKVVFDYRWVDGEYEYYCIVTQENGELKAYTRADDRR